jgi:hypothetical protein
MALAHWTLGYSQHDNACWRGQREPRANCLGEAMPQSGIPRKGELFVLPSNRSLGTVADAKASDVTPWNEHESMWQVTATDGSRWIVRRDAFALLLAVDRATDGV